MWQGTQAAEHGVWWCPEGEADDELGVEDQNEADDEPGVCWCPVPVGGWRWPPGPGLPAAHGDQQLGGGQGQPGLPGAEQDQCLSGRLHLFCHWLCLVS